MTGDILTEKWLRELYPKAEIKAAQFTCAQVSGVKNYDWNRVDSLLRGSTFFIGLVNANDITGVEFQYKGHLVGSNDNENNDYMQLMKFDAIVAVSSDDFFQLFGYLVTLK